MPNDNLEAEAKLQKLARRLHQGWAKTHPATEKELAAVRAAIQAQWEQEQKIRQNIENAQAQDSQSSPQNQSTQQSKSNQSQNQTKQSQDEDHGHSH